MKHSLITVLLACAVAGCGGVGRTTPYYDARFGQATRAAFAQQILNPQAARDKRPVAGMDGQSAVAAQQRYQSSFTEPPAPASAFTIGISGNK